MSYFASHVSDQYSKTIPKGVCDMDLIGVIYQALLLISLCHHWQTKI